MAIRLTLGKTDRILFCGSKWWGDPDMPENMQYPTMEVTEDGETYEYPLTFVCQINCEDIAPFDREGRLPHEGMLYFFAAIDEYIGYGSPVQNPVGEWPKGRFVVKYAKSINFETFQSYMLVGEEEEQLTEPELEIIFSECGDDEPCLRLLGAPDAEEGTASYPDAVSLLRVVDDPEAGLYFGGRQLSLIMTASDLRFGNWKRGKAYLKRP